MARHTTRRANDPQSALDGGSRLTKHHERPRAPEAPRKHAKVDLKTHHLQRYPQKKDRQGISPRAARSGKSSQRATISTAVLFKRERRSGRSDKRNQHGGDEDPQVIADFDNGLKEARWAISDKTRDTFDKVYTNFTEKIDKFEETDREFFNKASHRASLLSAPLAEERLETNVRRNGEQAIDIVQIGNRVSKFKKLVDTEEQKLANLWKQWDELQEEYIKLGVEVLGAQKFGDSAAPYKDLPGGYMKDMENWNLEHKANIEEVDHEIEGIGVKIMHKMRATEKQLDASAKREQARLLQAIM